MSSSRRSRLAAVVTVIAVATGLVTLASPVAQTVEQIGTPNNYYGPGPCPDGGIGWNCVINAGDVEIAVVQKAATAGINRFECAGSTCGHPTTGGVTQTGVTSLDQPTNEATCGTGADGNVTDPAEQTTTQTCDVHQPQGETNTINIKFKAAPRDSETLSGRNMTQSSTQEVVTEQQGNRNKLTVTLTIDQATDQVVNTSAALVHDQQTLMRSQNTMSANTSNEASYAFVRKQASRVGGRGDVTQLQDTSTDGGLGEVNLVANSTGWNDIDFSADDMKTQNAISLTGLSPATQTMGRSDDRGGWLAQLDVDSGTPNPNGPDIDVGDAGDPPPAFPPGPRPGIRETWNQAAWATLVGENTLPLSQNLRTQSQYDGIGPLPLIGKSPFTMISNDRCDLTAQQGALIVAHHEAGKIAAFPASTGHVKESWTGGISCTLTAGNLVRNPFVYWEDKTDVAASLTCQENPNGTATCPDATVTPLPVSHAHAAIRNEATESFTGDEAPNTTSAQPGQIVEERAIFHNAGETGSLAKNATLITAIPAQTSFVSCSNNCAVSPDNIVSWNLNDEYPDGVPGGTAVSRTLRVNVNDNATPGSDTTHATGDDDEEDAFVSNDVTLTVVPPPPVVREIVIDVLEQTINASSPKNGVTNVVINDLTLKPATVCFGDTDDPNPQSRGCTTGTVIGTANYDTDPEQELKMKFLIKNTKLDPGDTQACLTAETTNPNETVHGCDSVVVN